MTTDEHTERPFNALVSIDAWKRVLYHVAWLAPGVIALFPYMMQTGGDSSIAGAFHFYVGMFPWLWERPLRIAMLVPTLIYWLRFIRVGKF